MEESYQPVVVGALGDLFLRHDDGRIFWLSSNWGQLTEVAKDADQFQELMVQHEHAAMWFMPDLVGDIMKAGQRLREGEWNQVRVLCRLRSKVCSAFSQDGC